MFRYERLKNVGRNHAEAPAVFSYETSDLLDEVARDDYFNDPRADITNGDFVLVKASDGVRLMIAGSSTSAEPPVENFVFINDKNDYPEAINGVITLKDNTTYYHTAEIDLEGDRVVGGRNTVILGPSSEQARLKSTGLTGSPLVSSEWSMPIRHITFEADEIFNLDATANANQALDWLGVNFVSENIGTIKNYNNFVSTSLAFLGASGMVLDGTFGTVAFTETLFSGTTGATITIPSTATITRRFRIGNSSIVCPSGNTGLDVSTSASIPTEGYILDKVNFSGVGTYTSGVTYSDNKSRWEGCRGVVNSANLTGYYMNSNATTTTIASTGVPVKVAGTTTEISTSQRFTVTSNRATYVGSLTRDFKVTLVCSVSSGNGQQIGVYIAKNGTELDESETYITTNATGRLENGTCQVVVTLNQNDYIEMFIENNSATTDITVEDLNLIVEALN